jgi:hypothetical protein
VSKPGNTRRRGEQTDHTAPAARPRYVTHEEQYRALVAHMRRRDRRVARALVTVLSADVSPTVLAEFGVVLDFVADQERSRVARGPR